MTFPAWLLSSRLVLSYTWDTLSASLFELKTMDLINWSLNAIDTIFSTRSSGSGEPACPAGTFAAGYTMDTWERSRVVCLAALSVEDVDIYIYVFGTMITGFLLFGFGAALVYWKINETVTAVKSPLRLPESIWKPIGKWEENGGIVVVQIGCSYLLDHSGEPWAWGLGLQWGPTQSHPN